MIFQRVSGDPETWQAILSTHGMQTPIGRVLTQHPQEPAIQFDNKTFPLQVLRDFVFGAEYLRQNPDPVTQIAGGVEYFVLDDLLGSDE